MIENVLSKKWIFLVMAFLLVVFLREDRLILNVPLFLNVSLFFLSFCLLLFCLYRFNLQKSKKEKKSNLITDLLGCVILSFFVFILFKLAVNFYIEKSVKELSVKEIKLPIDNFISGRTDLVYFYFKDKTYSLRYNNTNNLSKKELIDNYVINIKYGESVFNTYVIKNYNIEIK